MSTAALSSHARRDVLGKFKGSDMLRTVGGSLRQDHAADHHFGYVNLLRHVVID
jgi:hypothetical protein